MPKILVFTPPVDEGSLMPMINAGMGAVSGWLRDQGYDFDQKSLMIEARHKNMHRFQDDHYDLDVFDQEEVLEYLKGEDNEDISREANKLADYLEIDKYDIVLMSTISISSLKNGLPILKERSEDKLTIIGGPMTLTNDLEVARLPFIDYGVLGDAEVPLKNILDHELNGKPLEDFGIIYGDKDGCTKGEFCRYPMDRKPKPHYEDKILQKAKEIYAGDNYLIPYQFGRGCTQDCSFCNYFNNRKYQYKDIDKVVRELKELKEGRPNASIFFTDSNLFNDPNYVEKFAKRMKEEDIDISWSSQAIILSRGQEFFDTLAEGGCEVLFHGIESASNSVLHRMRKAETRRMIEDTLEKEYNAGIKTNGFFIVNFVGETKEEYFDTIDFLKSNRHMMGGAASYLMTTADGRTPLYKDQEDFGIELENPDYEDFLDKTFSKDSVDYSGNRPEPFASKEKKAEYANKVISLYIYYRNFGREHPVQLAKKTFRELFKKDYISYDWLYA